jgi:hypothetical protein
MSVRRAPVRSNVRSAYADPPPILRHSIAWSIASASFAFALVANAVGIAYGGGPEPLIAGLLVSAGGLALAGAAYAGVLVWRRKPSTSTRAYVPLAVCLNLAAIALAISAAAFLRW